MASCEINFDSCCTICKSIVRILDVGIPSELSAVDGKGSLQTTAKDIRSLKESASKGCHLCNVITNCVHIYSHITKAIALASVDSWPDGLGTHCLTCEVIRERYPKLIKITIAGEEKFNEDYYVSGALHCDLLDSKDVNGLHRPVGTSTSSDETVYRVRKWLENCVKNHSLCKRLEDTVLPARLIEVTTGTSGLNLRLTQTKDFPVACQYATLSYCWGASTFLQLNQQNYDSFIEYIPFADLPKTFVDAITFANKLQLRFIWIDALCIIQDSPDDWAHESAMMGHVYSGALLNIAAGVSDNVEGGLFRCRNPLAISPFVSNVKWHPTKSSGLVSFAIGSLYEDLGRIPLSKRGWCFQERLLAQRTVHFTNNSIVWECNESTEPEASLSLLATMVLSPVSAKIKHLMVHPTRRPSEPYHEATDPVQMLWDDWKIIVGVYAQTEFTYKTDKLVALSSIARKLDQLHGSCGRTYLGGMWAADLVSGLLWHTYNQSVRHDDLYLAPSWSWASVEGPVSWYNFFDYTAVVWEASIIEATTILIGKNVFGPVRGGIMIIRGSLGRARLLDDTVDDTSDEPNKSKGTTTRHISLELDDQSSSALAVYRSGPLYLLGLVERKDSVSDPNRKILQGLVLLPDQVNRGQFSRVGYFYHIMPEDVTEPSRSCTEDIPLAELSEDLYEEYHGRVDGVEQYTIRVR